MFIRKKGKYNYLVENQRENGKVKQRVIVYLGERIDNVPDALSVAIRGLWHIQGYETRLKKYIEAFPDYLKYSDRKHLQGRHSSYKRKVRHARRIIENTAKNDKVPDLITKQIEKIRLLSEAAEKMGCLSYREGSNEFQELETNWNEYKDKFPVGYRRSPDEMELAGEWGLCYEVKAQFRGLL